MKKASSALFWGIALVVLGLLALLSNLDLLGKAGALIWGAVFALAGLLCVYAYVRNSEHWWALIPGLAGIGLGLLVAFGDQLPENWAPLLFLGPLGLSFLLIYLVRRGFWWTLIPAGALLSICLVVLASQQDVFDEGSLMLIGLGLTFAAVALVPKPRERFRWAWIPAGILFILGVSVLSGSLKAAAFVWPAVIIAAGAFFLVRALLTKPKQERAAEACAQAEKPAPPEPPAPSA